MRVPDTIDVRGLRQYRRPYGMRSNNVTVALYDGEAAGLDTSRGGRWITRCETHRTVANHRTFEEARRKLAVVEEWCAKCYRAFYGIEEVA